MKIPMSGASDTEWRDFKQWLYDAWADPDRPDGCWVAASIYSDNSGSAAVFASEIDALRHAVKDGSTTVRHVEWGGDI